MHKIKKGHRLAKLDTSIDIENLEAEWQRQVTMVDQCNTRHAKAVSDELTFESALSIAKAEVGNDARLHPEKYGIEVPTGKKITEASITEAMKGSAIYQSARDDYYGMKERVGALAGTRDTLTQRSEALRALTDLVIG